jgi:hypothetical protein
MPPEASVLTDEVFEELRFGTRKEKLDSRRLKVEVDLMLAVGEGLYACSCACASERFAESVKGRFDFRLGLARNDMVEKGCPLAHQCKGKRLSAV